MASKIVYLEVLDDKALDDMFAFIGNLIRNKYNNHKLDTTIGFAISARGVQKIEFVARKTDFKEIEDGSPRIDITTAGSADAVAQDARTPSEFGNNAETSNMEGLNPGDTEASIGTTEGVESSSVSDADPGDSQPDSDSGC